MWSIIVKLELCTNSADTNTAVASWDLSGVFVCAIVEVCFGVCKSVKSGDL